MSRASRWFLGHPPRIRLSGAGEFNLYIGSAIQETVAFIGFRDQKSDTGMQCEGTGFFVLYKDCGYLVTNRHVAEIVGSDPFVVRVNRRGQADLIDADMANWSYHPDPTVDVAVVPLTLPVGHGFDCKYFPDDLFLLKRGDDELRSEGIGVGSLTYVVGLFHFIYGRQKNLPIAHCGNIALLPPAGERIPMWNKGKKTTDMVEAYLIESAAINGASGSPVFVRPALTDKEYRSDQEQITVQLAGVRLWLLGIFSGAWFAPPDDPVRQNVNAGKGDVVPVGVGVVVPAYRILEAMETPEMQEYREKNRPLKVAAQQTSAAAASPQSNDANPNHRADFTRLLNAAARKPEPKD
jgi:hypothetical protein